MAEERRSASIEAILVTLGRLEENSKHIKETVSTLSDRVGIQNGKVGRLERWQSYIQGALMIIILMVVPIIINFISSWLKFTFKT